MRIELEKKPVAGGSMGSKIKGYIWGAAAVFSVAGEEWEGRAIMKSTVIPPPPRPGISAVNIVVYF